MSAKAEIRRLLAETRWRIGNTPLSDTARKLDKLLRQGQLGYLVVGGYAVQEYGYPRFTEDLDFVVRDRARARDYLLATGEFRPVAGSSMTVIDRANGVPVDLLPAGQPDRPRGLAYPMPPTDAGVGLQFVSLPGLVELKLGANRYKDRADVAELIKRLDLPLNLADDLDQSVAERYTQVWQEAQVELSHERQEDHPQPEPATDVPAPGGSPVRPD
jgi:hypothetical protein